MIIQLFGKAVWLLPRFAEPTFLPADLVSLWMSHHRTTLQQSGCSEYFKGHIIYPLFDLNLSAQWSSFTLLSSYFRGVLLFENISKVNFTQYGTI